MSNTPYDDVFRTLLNDCSSLALPLRRRSLLTMKRFGEE